MGWFLQPQQMEHHTCVKTNVQLNHTSYFKGKALGVVDIATYLGKLGVNIYLKKKSLGQNCNSDRQSLHIPGIHQEKYKLSPPPSPSNKSL